jgi:hypothetical protein
MAWIVLGVVILVAVISAISQMIKNQEESAPKRTRSGRSGSSGGVRSSSGDIDRFLQEIDRLRNKRGEAGAAEAEKPKSRPVAKPVRPAIPVVEPARRSRIDTDAAPRPVPTSSPSRVEQLPVAAVVPPEPSEPRPARQARQARQARPAPPPPAQPHAIAALGQVASRPTQAAPRTDAGRQLLVLLQNPQSVPVAVLLQEILGPPKCRQ